MSPTISVVIPTFNRPEATLRAIDSALGQIRKPDEIIVVDDASAPPFSAVHPSLSDPCIRVVTLSSNQGAAAARQAGVDAATGDMIAFLDSDDRWLPDKLARQIPLISQNQDPLVAVSCGWIEEGDQSRTRTPIASADPADFASGCWFCPGSTVLVPRAAFTAVGPFDLSLRRLEDLEWFLRFALCGGRIEVAPVIGATISIGRRGRRAPVEHASSRISERFSGTLEPAVLRRLRAYLELERAMAARNDGSYHAVALHLARSLINYPRLRLPLRQWWQEGHDP